MPMYNPIQYSSNYSETTGSLWFYSNDETFNFKADTEDCNNFKSFKYETKLKARQLQMEFSKMQRLL